ncbi:aminoglycoside phosphotransferase family protein [Halomonas sp. WWR20]
MPHRLDTLRQWLARHHTLRGDDIRLELAAGDASFRRYFRLTLPNGETRIVMDAPPDKEDSQPFVAIAQDWHAQGLPVPRLYAKDLEAGFLELQDLGNDAMHLHLDDENGAALWYERAMALLEEVQQQAPAGSLPVYDRALLTRELDLFPEWCLNHLLGMEPPRQWPETRQRLIEAALAQPRVAVHRDYDAMNLMIHEQRLWLIDFQDAVHGPITYDLVSLLRGRYRRWPQQRFAQWVEAFRLRATAAGRLDAMTPAAFLRMTEEMGAQRCLKVLGIFSRLALRDDKPGYLAWMPRFLEHLREGLAPWPEHADFITWLDDTFAPRLCTELRARGISGNAS